MPTFLLRLLPLCCALLCLASPTLAQDPLVAKAVDRIAKVEAAEPNMPDGDQKTAQSLLTDLAWAEKRLNAVVQKGTAEWKAAEARAAAIRKKVETKAKKSPPAPAPTPNPEPSPAPKPAPTPDPAPKPGSGPKPAPAPAPTPVPTYDHAKLVQLNKEIGDAWNNFRIVPRRLMADANRSRSTLSSIERFHTRLDAFPKGDSNVELVRANLADFEKEFTTTLETLQKDQAAVAEIDQRIEAMHAKYDKKNMPGRLEEPFNEGQIQAWASQLRNLRDVQLPADVAWLQSVADNAAVEQNKITGMLRNLEGRVDRDLGEVEMVVRERIASKVEEAQRTSAWILETDPTNQNHVLARILGKGAFDRQMTRLRDGEQAVAMASVYDQAMASPCIMGLLSKDPAAGAPAQPDRKAQAGLVQKAIGHLRKCAETALDSVRMPKAASESPELLKIAADTLKLKKYEVAGWERLVIHMDKVHREKREAWLSPGTVSSSIDFYTYAWDEFQVTTAEKHGEEIWLYANRLKLFSSGDSTTPIGHWILSQRFELTRILPENLDKPPLPDSE